MGPFINDVINYGDFCPSPLMISKIIFWQPHWLMTSFMNGQSVCNTFKNRFGRTRFLEREMILYIFLKFYRPTPFRCRIVWFLIFYVFSALVRSLYLCIAENIRQSLLKKLLFSCNQTLKNVEDETLVPNYCYFKMKWRQALTQETLDSNTKSLANLGKKSKK